MIVHPSLLAPRGAPTRPEIDLRCCDVTELIADLRDQEASLVIADPPWTHTGADGTLTGSAPSEVYACLDTETIAAHVYYAARLAPRLALWLCWPLLAEWTAVQPKWWGTPVTGGSWVKSGAEDTGRYGHGFHWAGCSEPVLVYTQPKHGPYTDRTVTLRNAWIETPNKHSRKPVGWQTQWIRRWVPPGGLVVDLYAGLGSVAEAVLLAGEGRRYIGAEIDPERHASALSLLAQART